MPGHRFLNICGFSRICYWHGIHGGMDVHGRLLTEALVRRGHRVTLICTAHPDGRQEDRRNGVRILYLQQTAFGSRRAGWPAESARTFRALDRDEPFDLIWSQSYDAFGLAGAAGRRRLPRPMLATLHGCISQEFKTFRTNIRHPMQSPAVMAKALAGLFYSYFYTHQPVLQAAQGLIAVSTDVRKDLRRWYGRHVAAKCRVVPNGLDAGHFRPDPALREAARRRFGIDQQDLVLLSLGRITTEKGHHLAVEALKNMSDARRKLVLMVVGAGPGLERLRRQVANEGLQAAVIVVGPVDNRQTVDYYNCADVFLMPTLTVEGLPYVLLEAMACGLPVVATRLGGNTNVIVNGQNGLLVEPGNKDQLTDALDRLCRSAGLRRRLAAAARETIRKKYTTDKMVTRVEHQMRSLCCPGTGPDR
jgi:glycosyltransferase involved in cell wall biosynthesis